MLSKLLVAQGGGWRSLKYVRSWRPTTSSSALSVFVAGSWKSFSGNSKMNCYRTDEDNGKLNLKRTIKRVKVAKHQDKLPRFCQCKLMSPFSVSLCTLKKSDFPLFGQTRRFTFSLNGRRSLCYMSYWWTHLSSLGRQRLSLCTTCYTDMCMYVSCTKRAASVGHKDINKIDTAAFRALNFCIISSFELISSVNHNTVAKALLFEL